jgi:alpha-1,4-digalacturonate transport system substrate-binding protein
MNKRKRTFLLVLSMILVFVMAACGKDSSKESASKESNTAGQASPSQAAPSVEPEKKKVTLDYVWFTDGVEGDVMKGIIQDYQTANPNVTINLIEVAYKDLDTKLKTMIAGGKPPALSRMTNPGTYVNQALDLSPYVGDVKAFMGQFVSSVEPYYYIDNKIVSVPMDVTANGLIYNKTLFDKAGVTVPQLGDEVWTWDEFAAALKQVKEKGGAKHGMVWDFSPHRWSTMLYQFGGSIFSEDGTSVTINNENGIRAVEYFVKLHKEGLMPESVWLGGENPNNLFRTGTIAAHFSGNWMISNYKDIDNFEWGVTYAPKEIQRSSVPGGKYVMAFKGSGVEDETAAFIQYLSSQEINAKYTSKSLFISPRIDNAKLDYEFGADMFAVFADELANTPAQAGLDWSKQTIIPLIQTDIRDSVVEVLTGKKSAKAAMDAVAEKINTVLKDSK